MGDLDAQQQMLINRVRKNRKALRPWIARESVTCFRIYDRDIPEIPLAVDWYEGRLHVAEYKVKRPTPEGWARAMATALGAVLDVPSESIFVKSRQRQRGSDQYERVARAGEPFEVAEGGHKFWVNLEDYLDTGLFLDHRPTRKRVESEARDRSVLNLFAYTGAFTVYAAAGGARSSLSIDMSKTYCGWAADNLALNGLVSEKHRILQADVLGWLDAEPNELFDLIVLDPPTFSNSKRMERSFEIQRDHRWLLGRVLARLQPGGVCYFSTNFRRFKLDADAGPSGSTIEDITSESIPPDFRNRRIHHCFRISYEPG